jgi:Xaa-Pro aminopeptidase
MGAGTRIHVDRRWWSKCHRAALHQQRRQLRDGDLLLVDAGAEYKGYASDITRTFPINGRYTKPQREIYDLVLKAQMSCVEMVRPGVTHDQLKQHSIEVLTEGMVELGLLEGKTEELIKEKKYEKFYMHGLGHMLGIDVHDVGVTTSARNHARSNRVW